MMQSNKISAIQINDESTWADYIFLTFDLDWAHDEILQDVIKLVEDANASATWFITHQTSVLDQLRANSKFELGIHPNFNCLLEGDDRNGKNAPDVIQQITSVVPEAKSVRSHSMAQSSKLLNLFSAAGLTHDCNSYIPSASRITARPWRAWNGLIRVPHIWEDDLYCLSDETVDPKLDLCNLVTQNHGLKVFSFHPIHVFLNTESLDRYECTRPLHQKPEALIKHRYEGYGTRSRLLGLLENNLRT